jgi:hypothetical protein
MIRLMQDKFNLRLHKNGDSNHLRPITKQVDTSRLQKLFS